MRTPSFGAALVALAAAAALQAAPASANPVTLTVTAANDQIASADGPPVANPVHRRDAITSYRWIVNADDTGNQNDSENACLPVSSWLPDGVSGSSDPQLSQCGWTSIREIPGSAPIVTQGTQDDLDGTTSLDLPPGKYLISVTADGYKIDGAHFTVPANGPAKVQVQMAPYDLPLATLRVQVFDDNASVNGQWDEPVETGNGMVGFQAHLADVLGEVTTDWYGNPLCTLYQQGRWDRATNAWVNVTRADPYKGPYVLDADGLPVVKTVGGRCLSDSTGQIEIGNLGPNRYAVTTVPPDSASSVWHDGVRTTTLEGGHDWDTWIPEGATGYDTEFLRAGEPTPWTMAGFVHQVGNPLPRICDPTKPGGVATNCGSISGRVLAAKVYIPQNGGAAYNGTQYGGGSGSKPDGPINRPWVAISDLRGVNDQLVALVRGNADGTFRVNNLPASDYSVTIWDDDQDYLLDSWNVTIGTDLQGHARSVDMGTPMLAGWFTDVHGTVFVDANGNGRQDPGENGVPNFTLTLRTRNNALMDQGTNLVTTDIAGHYDIKEAYPLGQYLIVEAFDDRYQTTGVTYQADNQPTPTTMLGSGVDLSVLPIIGLGGRLDWGVKPYAPGTNGGIVGTVSYDSTRNELDPAYAAVEDYQPGVPGLTVDLYKPVPDGHGGYVRDPVTGAYALGPLLNRYTTEQWVRPKDCVGRDVDGNQLDQGFAPKLPTDLQNVESACIEAPAMGVQFGGDDDPRYAAAHPDANIFSSVDGNYGFGDGCQDPAHPATGPETCAGGVDPTPLALGDYIVKVQIPQDGYGKPLYDVTREEDVNVFTGDSFQPQIPPSPCVGALHVVDVAGTGDDGTYGLTYNGHPIPDTATENPGFLDAGGSPYEGQARPLCDAKLVQVQDRKSIAPTFNVFTQVPLPGKYWGLINDDLNLQLDPTSMMYGEVAGVANAPVGIYDFNDRLVDTAHSDENGLFEALEPSTSSYNCPLPAGPCPGMFRLVGNDPGSTVYDPATGTFHVQHNPDYNPQFITISAPFQLWPGLMLPADLAPTQIGVTIETPDSTLTRPVRCAVSASTPQLFRVSRPTIYTTPTQAQTRPPTGTVNPGQITITGTAFGATKGSLLLNGTAVAAANVTAWSDSSITFTLPATQTPGPYNLQVRTSAGKTTVNGITIHDIARVTVGGTTTTYNPTLIEVGPGKAFATIQAGLNRAAQVSPSTTALVVVYPNTVDTYNPDGAYYENVIMHSPVKLQGVGPGGTASGTTTTGTVIDGSNFNPDGDSGTAWQALATSFASVPAGLPAYEGEVIAVMATSNGQYPSPTTRNPNTPTASIDGLTIQGGTQGDFGGTPAAPGVPALITQGGGIYVQGSAHYLSITNNLIHSNSGAYGGGIRIGTPEIASNNDHLRIAYNRLFSNSGTNLAGGVGLFQGSTSYRVDHNDLCGNFSAEYGGAISHYGLSDLGQIDHNRIYFNRSYDEGGAVMVAGELPAVATQMTRGSGNVSVHDNLIEANLANDDGAGLRLLMDDGNTGTSSNGYRAYRIDVYDNTIANNISTHEGGGIAVDDATNVHIVSNTIVRNITTATAATSNGQPAPTGLSLAQNSALLMCRGVPLQANGTCKLPTGVQQVAAHTPPELFDNILWDNRAGAYGPAGVAGIGLTGDTHPIHLWDVGYADDPTYPLTMTNSVFDASCTVTTGANGCFVDPSETIVASPTNKTTSNPLTNNPGFVDPSYKVSIRILPWRNQPRFIGAVMVAADNPIDVNGDYHLAAGSPAINAGRAWTTGANATPSQTLWGAVTPHDIDDQTRPIGGVYDIGSDER